MAVVGIDLGTTNTVVACVRRGRVLVLADDEGRRLLPSVVSFEPGGHVLVGHLAKERRVLDAANTITSVKRLIGRAWTSEELLRSRQRLSFRMSEGAGAGLLVTARGQQYTVPEISAFVLHRAKEIAERALGETVDRAVITVPASFNELQRAATKVAGRVAGLDVLRIINEPTAAALAYGFGRSTQERIAVYDFGGGTFDCTLLDLSGNVFEVLATAGDSFLGGDDVDLAIAERMADAVLSAYRYDPRTDVQSFERLRLAGEALKVELSGVQTATTVLREVGVGNAGVRLDLDFQLTRAELESLALPLVDRTFAVCQESLSMSAMPVSVFDKVILVGGSTRMPLVRRRVEQFFGTAPLDGVNPEEVVAIGAAIQAAALTDEARRRSVPPPPTPRSGANPPPPPSPSRSDLFHPEDEPTLSTGLQPVFVDDGRRGPGPPIELGRDTRKATSSAPPGSARRPGDAPTLPFGSESRDGLGSVAPAESDSSHRQDAPVLVDVTPRALVVETAGGWCDVIVQRNAKIPCERSRAFTTSSDMQTLVRVRVAQGEGTLFGQNAYLGEVVLSDLRPAPRGQVALEVRFEVDESGTLNVQAMDVSTGRAANVTLQLVGIAGATSIQAMQLRHSGARLGR